MVDKFNIKKMAFTKDSIFNTFVTRITISFSDSGDTLRAKIGDTLFKMLSSTRVTLQTHHSYACVKKTVRMA